MSLGHALRIDSAGEAATDGRAFEHTERVRSAGFGGVTVVVGNTVGNRRLLAGRQYWVPLVSVLAFASRVTRDYIRFALLMSSADHFAARIHALASAAVEDKAEGALAAVRVASTARCYHRFR